MKIGVVQLELIFFYWFHIHINGDDSCRIQEETKCRHKFCPHDSISGQLDSFIFINSQLTYSINYGRPIRVVYLKDSILRSIT